MTKDKQFIEQLKSGDKKALDTIYLSYRNEFISFANKFSLHKDDALDIYQDSIIVFYENVRSGKLKDLTSTVKTYLFSIGKYKIYNTLNERKKIVDQTDFEASSNFEDDSLFTDIPEEQTQKLQESFEKLGKKCREVLRLFYYEGQSIGEIQNILHYTSKDVVKSQKSRCIKQLKELVNNQ